MTEDKLQQKVEEINQVIEDRKNIVVTTHNNPDGDAIGSSMALYHYLKLRGKQVSVVIPNMYPQFLAWIPGSSEILIYDRQSAVAKKALNDADLIFCLDYNAINRLGSVADIVKRSEAIRILIDHHIDPELESFNHAISTVNTSSTSELIYDFINASGDNEQITREIAEALYAGIVTDTGSFSFSCNKKETWMATADLIAKGVDAQKLHRLIYDTFSENRLRLLGYAIHKRMIVWEDFHTALIYLTKADLEKFKFQVGDTEGIVNYPLSMEKINQSILLTEKEKMIRMSFRSKGSFSVNNLVNKHFNGGGHKNAAGGKSFTNMEKTIEEVKKVLRMYKNELNYTLNYHA